VKCRRVLIVSSVAREKSPMLSLAGVAGMALSLPLGPKFCTIPYRRVILWKGLSLPSREAEMGSSGGLHGRTWYERSAVSC